MNERSLRNDDGRPTPCQLITLFGASNELPEGIDSHATRLRRPVGDGLRRTAEGHPSVDAAPRYVPPRTHSHDVATGDQFARRQDALKLRGDAAAAVPAPVHDPPTQQSPAAQTVPHAPQFLGSVGRSVHTPPQTAPEQAPHEPFVHDSLGPQCLPHAPQFVGSQFMSGQKPSHCMPAGHAWHDEPVQVSVAAQRLPHAPQLLVSHLKLTQESLAPPTPWQTVLPLVQHEPQAPSTHVSPAPQALPHAPQLPTSDFRSTQAPPQVAPRQDEHAPSLQDEPSAQALPQAPQLIGSDLVSVQDAPHTVPAQQEAALASAGVQTFPQLAGEIRLSSIVTAPFRARALPARLTRVPKVMLVSARMFPVNAVSVPSVAELPTCQNTRHSPPPWTMTTDELLAVVSVLPIWKMKSALGSFSASRMSLPVSWADDERQ
jgi:hypothetical protein